MSHSRMNSVHHVESAAHNTDSMELSDSEISINSNEERNYNNHRLTEAINYMAAEGDGDPQTTFIHRVDRFHKLLVQQLPQNSSEFDHKLYRRVRAMVRATQREYEDAMGHSSLLNSEEDDIPGVSTSAAATALHRTVTAPPPQARPMHPRPKLPVQNTGRQRVFKYGGPHNEPETWMKDYPAILPFPETFQMSTWESLKIHFDLSDIGKKLKAEGKIIETNIPFDHPALAKFKNLDQYESGSRYMLPESSEADKEHIAKFASDWRFAKVVQEFNEGDRAMEIKMNYVPRIALESFEVEHDTPPTDIRHSINTTPTKQCRPTRNKQKSRKETRSAATSAASTHSTPSGLHTTTQDPQNSRSRETSMTPGRSNRHRTTAALRAFQHTVDEALRDSPRRQSSIIGTKTATHVAISANSPPYQPNKAMSKHVASSASVSKAVGKRKRVTDTATDTQPSKRKTSLGTQAYSPLKRSAVSVRGSAIYDDASNSCASSEDENEEEPMQGAGHNAARKRAAKGRANKGSTNSGTQSKK